MTCALSSKVLAMAARKPPIAACIKAESAARAKAVILPPYTNFSLDWTNSGSYDRVHFLSYLVCWLEKWDPARAAANDYRILVLDVAACHMGKEIEDYCWECGYVLVYHYGGTTSVMQAPTLISTNPFPPCTWKLNRTSSLRGRSSTQVMSIALCKKCWTTLSPCGEPWTT